MSAASASMTEGIGLSQADLLQRGRAKLAAFRQAKQQEQQQQQQQQQPSSLHNATTTTDDTVHSTLASSSSMHSASMAGDSAMDGSTVASQPSLNGHVAAANGQHEPGTADATTTAATFGDNSASIGQADGLASASAAAAGRSGTSAAAPVPVTAEQVAAMQQHYHAYYAQYGADPQYAPYFAQLAAQVEQAVQQLQLQQQQAYLHPHTQPQSQHSASEPQPHPQQQQPHQSQEPGEGIALMSTNEMAPPNSPDSDPAHALGDPSPDHAGTDSASPAFTAAETDGHHASSAATASAAAAAASSESLAASSDAAAAAPAVAPSSSSSLPDYASSSVLDSFTPEQRASFLSFATYFHDPAYAAFYANMQSNPEYHSYFATMEAAEAELAARQQQQQQQEQQRRQQQQEPQRQLYEQHDGADSLSSSVSFSSGSLPPLETIRELLVEVTPVSSTHASPIGPITNATGGEEGSFAESMRDISATFAEANTRKQQLQLQQQREQQQQLQALSEAQAASEHQQESESPSAAPSQLASTAPHADAASFTSTAAATSSVAEPADPTAELEQPQAQQPSLPPHPQQQPHQQSLSSHIRSSTPSAAELTSTVSVSESPLLGGDDTNADSEGLGTHAGSRGSSGRVGSGSPVLLQQSDSAAAHSRQVSEASEAFSAPPSDHLLQPHDDADMPPPLESELYTLSQESEAQQQQQQQQQLQHPEHQLFDVAAGNEPDVDATRTAVLSELNDLRAALAAKQAQIDSLSASLPHNAGGAAHSALMCASDEDSSSSLALREGVQVSNLNKTIASLSREVDSLRLDNERLFHQQELLRRDVGDRNAKMEAVQHDNVALLLEMETLETELAKTQQHLASMKQQQRPLLTSGSPALLTGSSTCEHSSLLAELHELQLQVAPVWQKNLDLTQALEEAVLELQHACADALASGSVDGQQLRRLTAGLPAGLSATPAGTSSSSSTAETAQQHRPRARSNSDPALSLDEETNTASTAQGTGDQAQSGMSTPPRKSSSTAAQQQQAVALSAAVQSSVSSVQELLRSKSAVEAQLFALLRRVQDLCEPMSALMAGVGDVAGVQKSLKALQKQKKQGFSPLLNASAALVAHPGLASPGGANSGSGPGGAVLQRSDDSLLHAQVSELRAARDSLASQLSAQLERAQALVRDKIFLAKKIEDTYEERQLVVENLREEIAALRAQQQHAGGKDAKAVVPSSSPRSARAAASDGGPNKGSDGQDFEQYYRSRYDSALGDHDHDEAQPASAVGGAETGAPAAATPSSNQFSTAAEDARRLNAFYVEQLRATQSANAAAAAAAAVAEAAAASAAVAAADETEQDEAAADEEDEDEEEEAPSPRRSGGFFSSLISFFRVRFSQAAYEELLREAHRRRLAQQRRMLKKRQLQKIEVVAL